MTPPDREGPRVLLCHPGRQHSHQLAMALAEQGWLARYVTGVPTHAAAGGRLGRPFLRRAGKAYAIPIDPGLVRNVCIAPIVRKVAQRLLSADRAADWSHRADALFDRYVSASIEKLRPTVVVAYENGALHTFRKAKQSGATTVLDAASFHHAWQDRFCEPVEKPSAHRRITQRKDDEIALADRILTVSELARESYLEAGVPRERIQAIPVGVDSNRFQANVIGRESGAAVDRDIRFVYVGNASRLKGLNVLCEAAGRLRTAGAQLTATLIGVSSGAREIEPGDGMVKAGWMSHDRLAMELPQHDVLILPSFFDSFGMVVAEAMACGLPAIVTQNVGAKEMVESGVNGLIVPAGDAAALAAAMGWFIDNRAQLPEMSTAARHTAERYDWQHYRRRIVDFISAL